MTYGMCLLSNAEGVLSVSFLEALRRAHEQGHGDLHRQFVSN
jgi:hypothetical protein